MKILFSDHDEKFLYISKPNYKFSANICPCLEISSEIRWRVCDFYFNFLLVLGSFISFFLPSIRPPAVRE